MEGGVQYLTVPIRVEALHAAEELQVLEPMADFTRLPQKKKDGAFLSEKLVSPPFQQPNLTLGPGIHLHWFLPGALTQTRHLEPDGPPEFPAVPDRWLVVRNRGADSEKGWVVESDYLHPPDAVESVEDACVPFPTLDSKPSYRYMGRLTPLEKWEPGGGGDYLRGPDGRSLLTAIGYGEPTFAAFYPNCRSVFGLHDDFADVGGPPKSLGGLRYEVLGWYGDPRDDFLKGFVERHRERRGRPRGDPLRDERSLAAALAEDLGWTAGEPPEAEDLRLLCHAGLELRPQGAGEEKGGIDAVALANTGTEALSAYLAAKLAKELPDRLKDRRATEDALEAVLLADRLAAQTRDRGPRFRAARHENGFVALDAGTAWTIEAEPEEGGAENGDRPGQSAEVPEELAPALAELNRAQERCDRARHELISWRRLLFSDWYEYLKSVHGVELEVIVEEQKPPDSEPQPPDGGEPQPPPPPYEPEYAKPGHTQQYIRGYVLENLSSLFAKDDELEKELGEAREALAAACREAKCALEEVGSPRYWQPNEPALVLAGDLLKKHSPPLPERDGRLECRWKPLNGEVASMPSAELSGLLEALRSEGDATTAVRVSRGEPFMLDWAVDLFPLDPSQDVLEDEGSEKSERARFHRRFITDNYDLKTQATDLARKKPLETLGHGPRAFYQGSSILTPHAGEALRRRIAAYLSKRELKMPADIARWKKAEVPGKIEATGIASGKPPHRDPAYVAMAAYWALLQAGGVLSQALGGFNAYLLGHKQTLQLPVADPLGDVEKAFCEEVRRGVGEENHWAPNPIVEFNPFRAGTLKLYDLRLIDTFGQVKELGRRTPVTPAGLESDSGRIVLPPRLAQPARLSFRWLMARPPNGRDEEANVAATPLCGWLVPNFLDGSLAVYDRRGRALGAIVSAAGWQPAPGGSGAPAPAKIGNPYLGRVVRKVIERKKVRSLLADLGTALEDIDPESRAGDDGLAFLFGRPMAVVRASLRLELRGRPAVHRGELTFKGDVERWVKGTEEEKRSFERSTAGSTEVRFPVRLGASAQLDDGLVGYWREGRDERRVTLGDFRTAKQAAEDPEQLTVCDEPRTLTLLMDPRGAVHATSGILPAKALRIPPQLWADALEAIRVTFEVLPVLADRQQPAGAEPPGRLRLPLAEVPGHAWSWLQRDEDGAWTEIEEIHPVQLEALFEGPQAFREGWLELRRAKPPAGRRARGEPDHSPGSTPRGDR